jgi:hypothetical protein
MHACRFTLNNQPMSAFEIAGRSYPAFSGLDHYINQRAQHCTKDLGPIPIGTYYVVDRESGGRLGWLRDLQARRHEWFALYADDGKIDDRTFCNGVQRGEFRLHAKAGFGISKGCIVLDRKADFDIVRGMLLGTKNTFIPGTPIRTYGKVTVR